jgi:hypothetical protein
MVLVIMQTASVAIAGDVGAVVDLVLLPADQTVEVGDVFDIIIKAQCNGQDVTGISAYLDFDPNYLEVQSVTPGITLDLVLQNTYNNKERTIDYSAGTFTSPFPGGNFTVATVTFKKIKEVVSTSISFHTNYPRGTNADYGGASKLRNLKETTITTLNTTTNSNGSAEEGNDENVEEDNSSSTTLKPAAFSTANLIISPPRSI